MIERIPGLFLIGGENGDHPCTPPIVALRERWPDRRSVSRAARMALSVGRPSRLMMPPGILHAAYIRSS